MDSGRTRTRLLVAASAAAVAAAFPAAADAARWKGTVVAKDAERGTVVTATRTGEARTLRARARTLRRLGVGRRVAVRARTLGDGTYRALSVRRGRRVRSARVRATVVRHDVRHHRYLVSAGESVFAIRARTRARTSSAHGALEPGDVIVARVSLGSHGPVESRLVDIGHTSLLKLEGIFLDVADGTLRLAVERRGLVEVAMPEGVELPAIDPGDEIELVVSVGSDGVLTFVGLEGDGGVDLHHDDSEVEIEGLLTALSPGEVTVEAEHGGARVTCSLPAGAIVDGFAVGDAVEMRCAIGASGLVLREIESETAELEIDEEELEDDEDDADEDDLEDEEEEDEDD